MEKYQKGFAPIVIIVLVSAVLVVGGGAWYYTKNTKPKPAPAPVTEQKPGQPTLPEITPPAAPVTISDINPGSNFPTSTPESTAKEPIPGWKIYNNDKYGIRFSYPPSDDFKALDWQSATDILASGTAKNIDEARSLARRAFDPHYEKHQLMVTFGDYSLGVGKMSVDLETMMKERTKFLLEGMASQTVSDTMIGGIKAKKITIVPNDEAMPFWEAHIVGVVNVRVYDFAFSGLAKKDFNQASFDKSVALLEKIAGSSIFTDKTNTEVVKQLVEQQKAEAQLAEAASKEAASRAGDPVACQKFEGSLREQCFKEIGIQNSDAASCQNAGSLSGDCYYEIAKKKMEVVYCDKVSDITHKWICYYEVAKLKKDASICAKIDSVDLNAFNIRSLCFRDNIPYINDAVLCEQIGADIDTRNKCYMAVAKRNGQPALCGKIWDKELQSDCKASF